VEDMMADPQYQARGMFEQVEINGEPLKIPAILPKLDSSPGRTDWPGEEIGSHNDEVLRSILQLDDGQIEQLRADGVVS
jgi:crotonobetainyl-CoA:carnitine CoA-transferase CaiB-like acyl-CoA transferase